MKRGLLAAVAALLVMAGNAGAIALRNPEPVAAPEFDGRVMVRLSPNEASSLRTASLRGLARMRTSSSVLRGLDATFPLRAAAPVLEEKSLFAEARAFGLDRWFVLEVDPAPGFEAVAAKLRATPGVELVEQDLQAGSLEVAPNDSLFSKNWGHGNTGTFPAFNLGTGQHNGPNVGTVGFDTNVQSAWGAPAGYGSPFAIIAILDTGIDPTHPDLSQITGFDFVNHNYACPDSNGHGTACAGVAAAVANNTKGVAGAAGGCYVMPFRFWITSTTYLVSDAIASITTAVQFNARIISMSFSITRTQSVADALSAADAAGVILVAATGNNNGSSIAFPASHPKVIAVGAANPCGGRKRSSSNPAEVNAGFSTDSLGVSCDNEVWWGSNWGTAVKDDSAAVDLVAPTILPTTDIQGSMGYSAGGYSENVFNGTSCATPYVAGVAAMILSQHPTWTPAQVRAQLKATAIDLSDAQTPVGWDKYTGYGMVNAGLPDLVPFAAPGWSSAIVPRAAADATPGSVPAPTTLNGDVNSYLNVAVANSGDYRSGPDLLGIYVDAVEAGGGIAYDLPAGSNGALQNIAWNVRGGRHVVGTVVNKNDDIVEANEANNREAHQWSWVPTNVPTSVSTVVSRATPPNRNAGRADVPVSETTYDNVDAVRMIGPGIGISNEFWVIGLHGSDDATDLDLNLHNPTGSATANFTPGNLKIASQQGAGKTDWGIVNLGSDFLDNLDAASLLVTGSGASRFESRLSGDFASVFSGTTITIPGVAFTSDMMVAVHELQVFPGGAGDISLELNSSAPLHMAIYDPDLLFGNRAQASQYSTQLGLVQGLTCTRPQGSRTAIVVYRDRTEGTGPLTYTIKVRRPTAELIASTTANNLFAPSGVFKNGVGVPQAAPTVLDGNAPNTVFYYGYTNSGPATATGFTARELIDGVDAFTWIPGALNAGASIAQASVRNIRGGRHTLGFRNDLNDVIDEFNEIDNDHASQWVWSPLAFAMETPVSRTAPPDRTGGWAQVPVATTKYDNVDGLRPPFLQPVGNDGYWNFFALAPRTITDDVDLALYQPASTGPASGFTTSAGTSALPAGRIDYVGIDTSVPRNVDLGIVKAAAATGNLVVHGTKSIYFGADVGTLGPYVLGPDKLVTVVEFASTHAARQVRVINLSGGANLDLHVYDRLANPVPPRLPGDAAVHAQVNGDGVDEVLQFTPTTDYPAIVVTKRGTTDIAKTATFQIQLGNSTIGTDDGGLPTAVRLAPIVPNPVQGAAAIAFDLPRASTVSLAAYDVAGRHVATLASGSWKAGHHSVSWTPGARLASGVYLLRLEADGVESVRRMVVTR